MWTFAAGVSGPCAMDDLMSTTPHADPDVGSSVTCSEDASSEESIPQTETTPRRECRRSAKLAAHLAKRLARSLAKTVTVLPHYVGSYSINSGKRTLRIYQRVGRLSM